MKTTSHALREIYGGLLRETRQENRRLRDLLARAVPFLDHPVGSDCAPMYGCFCGLAELMAEIEQVNHDPA